MTTIRRTIAAPPNVSWDEATELPECSTWLLEASAGTGKTYQIAGLFVRLVAEYGLPIERILAITFTNAATAELRDRVRARLRTALDAVRAGKAPEGDDVVERLVAMSPYAPLEKRLELALRGFDLASISTIHGFTQRMLRELAFDSGQEPDLELLSDPSEVLEQVVDDALATIGATSSADEAALVSAAGVTREALLEVARKMTGATEPRVEPSGSGDLRHELARASVDPAAPIAGFARTVRARVEAELVRRRALTFDGMLSRLAERIVETGGVASPLASRIRERFDAALVDEFQDTDTAQWSVLRAAFHGHRRLLLIGDPKQAIYAFRGADVNVYLEAARLVEPSRRRTMVRNFRSDPRAVAAMNALFRQGSHPFDDAAIDYVEVVAERAARLDREMCGLEVRWLDGRVTGGAAGEPLSRKDDALAARLAAREALAWLEGGRAKLVDDTGSRGVEPGDVAVLVNGHAEAQAMRRALARAGIPSVAATTRSVFGTPVASWLAAWFDAVAGRGRDRSARAAVVTPLFGWTADELAWALAVADRGADAREAARAAKVPDRDWAAWTARLASAARRWSRRGFARTFDREATALDVYPRVRALPDGERHATDLRHLFELVHVEERARRAGPAALAAWLRAHAGVETDESVQRLESDARAVQIETVHASKGLEYPIVLLPFGWSARDTADKGQPFVVRAEGGPVLHVEMPKTHARVAAHASRVEEERREALRKTYVALTRAKHHTVVWYGPVGTHGKRSSATPFGRLLLRELAGDGFDDATMPIFDAKNPGAWPEAERRLDALAAYSRGALGWSAETPLDGAPPRWNAPERARVTPRAASWPAERASLDGPWTVTSYSALPGAADRDDKLPRDAPPTRDDERPFGSEDPGETTSFAPPSLGPFPEAARLSQGGGTRYGTFVHGVLEELDFRPIEGALRAKDGRSLEALVEQAATRAGFGRESKLAAELVARVPAVLATPLDGAGRPGRPPVLPEGFCLRDLAGEDRFDEVRFDLCLGDGTRFRRAGAASPLEPLPGCIEPARVIEALASSRGACGGAAVSWIDEQLERARAGRPLIGEVAGILTGSIDLVFRAGGRYFLADYKTNRIGESSSAHYASAWLDWEMARTGYTLQALLYTLALHRHLRARLRGYAYDEHIGGHLYLFLRGMAGPDTARDPASGRCLGVFGDRFPRELVEALDRALSPKPERAR